MSDKLKAAWTEFRAFADSHRKLMLGIACFIAGGIFAAVVF